MNKHISVYMIDLSGKVLNYDYSLCNAIAKNPDVDLTFVTTYDALGERGYSDKKIYLLSLVPRRMKHSHVLVKRILKAFEGILNYNILLFYILIEKPTILHFQWFPFMEVCSVDIVYIALFRFFSPSIKIIQTIHNVYPHNMTVARKVFYNKRFRKMDKYIDLYIVHTKSTLQEIDREFGVISNRINVVPHGVFKPHQIKIQQTENCEKKNIILYGRITPYKGADILLDAIQLLPSLHKKRLHITIAGSIAEDYLKELQGKTKGCEIDFLPYFVPDNELYSIIAHSDYIALPYRKISQSGVLLLALYFRKPLLVSDLPSFKETLEGFTDDMFFANGDPKALAALIIKYLDGDIDVEDQMKAIERLNNIYSWEEAARMTNIAYKNCITTIAEVG